MEGVSLYDRMAHSGSRRAIERGWVAWHRMAWRTIGKHVVEVHRAVNSLH